MPKKRRLSIRPDYDAFMISISCQKKDYWVAFTLNEHLNLSLRRIPDLPVPLAVEGENSLFQTFYCENADTLLAYFLVSNRGTAGRLFPALRNIDFFLMINGPLLIENRGKMVESVKQIPGILLAHPVELSSLKDSDLFLSSLELHLLESGRAGK